MKTRFKPQKILWLDMEMTGLDPVNDLPLEVAMIVTDWDFQELASFEGVAHWGKAKIQARFEKNRAFWWGDGTDAREQLLSQNENATTTKEQLEQQILQFLDEQFDDSLILLAGNSIHQDRRFIDQWFKDFSRRLHYRMLDVSAWKVVFEGKYRKKFAKPEKHRALEDIRGSIDELKYYLKKVKV